MSWVRLHTIPKCCAVPYDLWGAKEHYLLNKSRERYDLTEDGIKVREMAKAFAANPTIGTYENVRFIRSELPK